jgi:hypothetical protein
MSLRSQMNRYSIILYIFVIYSCHNNSKNSNIKSEATNSGVRVEDALSTFELEPGFKIELLAAEPLISDPVDMEIDEYGRLYG